MSQTMSPQEKMYLIMRISNVRVDSFKVNQPKPVVKQRQQKDYGWVFIVIVLGTALLSYLIW